MKLYYRGSKRGAECELSQPAKRFKLLDGSSRGVEKEEVEGGLELSEEIKRKRRQLTLRSPFRNLLRRTLIRNQNLTRLAPPPPKFWGRGGKWNLILQVSDSSAQFQADTLPCPDPISAGFTDLFPLQLNGSCINTPVFIAIPLVGHKLFSFSVLHWIVEMFLLFFVP